MHQCKDGREHSPSPWRIVRYHVPYYTWIMDATGGIVCMGFGASDEHLLLNAARLLAACERALPWVDDAEDYQGVKAAIDAAYGRSTQ
jgi:hypothetical protein